MAKHEELSFRDELMLQLASSFARITISMPSGDKYVIDSADQIAVGDSVANIYSRDGSVSVFRLLQISNIDVQFESELEK